MYFEINDYDSRQELFDNPNRYDNKKVYEEEYEFHNSNKILNNNIDSFIPPPNIISNEINNKINNIQNSLLNSNNASPFEDQNNDNYNSISNKSNFFEENIIPSPLNVHVNNYEKIYLKENSSINVLNLTDKIYEDDEHFKKRIISTKNINNLEKGKNKNRNRNKKSSKDIPNKKSNRKSLFINNNNKDNKNSGENSKKMIKMIKRRESFMPNPKVTNNLCKLKKRKSSAVIIHESEKNNNDTKNIEDNNTKINNNKKLSIKTIKEESSGKNSSQMQIQIQKYQKNKTLKFKKKNKFSIDNTEKDEKDDKNTTKKSNAIKKENVNEEKKVNNEINEKNPNNIKEINEIQNNKKDNKIKKKFCLFCCLNSKFDDSLENK